MSHTSDLSLRCINYNNRFVAARHDGLFLETPTRSTKESGLWTVTHSSSSWSLIHHDSLMRLSFDMNSRLITRWKGNKSTSYKSLEVKDGDRRLQLRLSHPASATVDNKFGLELFAENDPDNKASPVFLVPKGSNEIFRDIDPDFFSNRFTTTTTTTTKTVADIVDKRYDYVIIGSSFCCLAFIHQTLLNDPEATFIVLEKGLKYLPEHHQHCTRPSSPAEVEFRPWNISDETKQNEYIKNVHGQIPLLGGRSTYWSGWTPTPSTNELVGWPRDLTTPLQETYFGLAHTFLNVVEANNIYAQENNNRLYGTFQSRLKERLGNAANIASIEQILHAPLAMGNNRSIKFSTTEMLLSKKNVTVIYDCTVEKILHDGQKAIALQTSQGTTLPLNNSKLILAMSTLPATTLVLNSFKNTEFPQLSNVGKRLTGHFVSSVIARVPRQNLLLVNHAPDVELGAVYIAGMEEGAQYHLQLSGVAYTKCKDNSNINHTCKKYSGNSIPKECIDISNDFVVVSCSTLGELDYKNKNNQFNLITNGQCLTTNGNLKLHLNDQDKQLWDLMDDVTFNVMKELKCSPNIDDLEYWHEIGKRWKKDTPPQDQIRKKFLVHDASTMWIGDSEDSEAPVSLDYRLKGVDNVYITGGALWPTGGSWNPVLTIVAMAMHLADTINKSICDTARARTVQF